MSVEIKYTLDAKTRSGEDVEIVVQTATVQYTHGRARTVEVIVDGLHVRLTAGETEAFVEALESVAKAVS